jgi:mannose-6-phosphate isomerase-like protein (cupin superfamily)
MSIFDLAQLRAAAEQGGRRYHEFLRVPALSAGLYALPAGGTDPQQPHNEDEIYYVVAGQAHIQVGDASFPVQAGSIVFVPAGTIHRFHSITEALSLLVVFGPAEYTRAPTTASPATGSA